jgi:hypothetical protein
MDRRQFLQTAALTTAAAKLLSSPPLSAAAAENAWISKADLNPSPASDIEGHTLVCEFTHDSTPCKVYEDLRTREGAITFVSPSASLVLTKSAEAAFAEDGTPYLGLNLKDIGMSAADLLADKLLQSGDDPDPEQVKSAAPPLASVQHPGPSWRLPWDTFVGTKECFDTMPVFPSGSTRTYHPVQYFPEEHRKAHPKRFDGLLAGWMPAVRKVLATSDSGYDEVIVFGDVRAQDKFIVQTWHRTARMENGKMLRAVYGYSYPAFPPARVDPEPEAFYRALLVFATYWQNLLRDFSRASLPQNVWVDMSKHAFAKELMVRPGGVYPKYGAVDRDYYGSEYDGFQDIFTSSVCANLEWGRLEMVRAVIDNYFSDFVDAKGMINMRGPETAQFGMTLSLLARYFNYSGDGELLRKHGAKLAATAELLLAMHDESLRLAEDDPGYGLIHGWNESDSCLMAKPSLWWLPYYANNAFATRGLRDLARSWTLINPHSPEAEKQMAAWNDRSRIMQNSVVASMRKNIRQDLHPPYIGTYAGAKETFWESMSKEPPSPQQWPHRGYAELLHADILPPELANLVIDCMRAHGATTLGVVANVERPHAEGRDILGFISYGYAQMLLRLDRIEEFLLFLYSHRFHDHTRGSWVAGEVSGIDGDHALFCIPAQLTIPPLVRWMLVLEDSDADRLYFAKGLPREWVASGEEISVTGAPTRWGRVNMKMRADRAGNNVRAEIQLTRPGTPPEIQVKFRLPKTLQLQAATVNGRPTPIGGIHRDTVMASTENATNSEIVAAFD